MKTTLTARNKLKILIGFYQIVTQVELTYDVRFPPEVRELLRYFRLGITLGIQARFLH